MKHLLFFTFIVILFCGCTKTEDEKAQTLLAQIDSLYNKGKYSAALDSITQLRERFPKAVEARKHESQLQTETDRYRRNMLGVRRDSLKARYEAMCGVVRMIHMRQKQH